MAEKKAKTINAKAEEVKKDDTKKTKPFLVWLVVVILIAAVCGFFGYKYLLDFIDEIKAKTNAKPTQEISTPLQEKIIEAEPEIAIQPMIEEDFDAEFESAKQEILDKGEALPKSFEPRTEIQFTEELAPPANISQEFVEKQDLIIIYLAANALQNSADDFEFEQNLFFLEEASANYPAISGKVNLLGYASKEGLPNKVTLIEAFKVAAQEAEAKLEKSLLESFKNSVTDLVKVTDLQSKENAYGQYKNAETALYDGDYDDALEVANSLGAEDLAIEINNLKRVDETIKFIKNYARGKLVN